MTTFKKIKNILKSINIMFDKNVIEK